MIMKMVSQLDTAAATLQTLLYVDIVQPIFFKAGLMGYDEDLFR